MKKSTKSSKPKGFVTYAKTRAHAEILSNRIRKRYRHLSRKFKRQNINCFRLYDWDIPEVRAVVDWYVGHVVVAEYERLQTTDEWLPEMAKAVGETLNIPPEKMHIKRRRTKTKTGPRYDKMKTKGECFEVNERDLRFWVNCDGFLDTGLFSDHRDTRVIMKNLAKDKDFLNLFAYTGAFTCAAAAGGARSTVTVDRNATYLDWAKENLKLNKLWGPQHKMVKSDVSRYLKQCLLKEKRFNLALIDPPSFFQNEFKKVSFDIARDHRQLILDVLKVMRSGSLVFFSTNHQRFTPQLDRLPVKELKELTPKTIPEDYRNRLVHRCWQMTVI